MAHTTKIATKKSVGNGDLDGFRVTCTCGFEFTTTFELDAKTDAARHVEYMSKKTAPKKSKK